MRKSSNFSTFSQHLLFYHHFSDLILITNEYYFICIVVHSDYFCIISSFNLYNNLWLKYNVYVTKEEMEV